MNTNEETQKANELELFEHIVNHLHYVAEAQNNIKKQYGVDSAYDEETNTLFIMSKKYVNEHAEELGLPVTESESYDILESFKMSSAKYSIEESNMAEFLNVDYLI